MPLGYVEHEVGVVGDELPFGAVDHLAVDLLDLLLVEPRVARNLRQLVPRPLDRPTRRQRHLRHRGLEDRRPRRAHVRRLQLELQQLRTRRHGTHALFTPPPLASFLIRRRARTTGRLARRLKKPPIVPFVVQQKEQQAWFKGEVFSERPPLSFRPRYVKWRRSFCQHL